jgi:hypothetical protein
MAEQMSLDNILDGSEKPAPAAEAPAADAPAVQAEPVSSTRREHRRKELEAQGRDPDTGQFTKKEDAAPEVKAEPAKEAAPAKVEEKAPPVKAEAAPQQEMTAKEKAAFAGLADERRKRQELERRLAELTTQAPAKAAPAATTEPAKTFWDDPEGFLAQERQKTQQAVLSTRLQTAELIARQRHQDFDEKVNKFNEIVQSNPVLVQKWLASPDPAEFAYQTAKGVMEIEAAGGLQEAIAKARAEERTKMAAEFKEKAESATAAAAAQRAALPPSLSDVKGHGGGAQRVFAGPTSLDNILKG